MNWAAKDFELLKKLWASGESAAQIAGRLGYSRNAVCAKLTRLGLKRGRKPPTAKPRIMPVPKRRTTSLAACTPGGKGGVFAEANYAAKGINQAPALRHAR